MSHDRFYLCVTLPPDEQAVRDALAGLVSPDEYDLSVQDGKLDLEIWACPLIFQAPTSAAVQALVRKLAPTEVTIVYIEDDRGSTEHYLGPRHLVVAHLQQEHQARLDILNAAYQREMAHIAASADAFVCTQGW